MTDWPSGRGIVAPGQRCKGRRSGNGNGYVANSPDEVCYLVVRKPGDTEDAADPQQVIFPREREEPATAAQRRAPVTLTISVEQLRRNAEDFEYAIGKPGGALTFATIGDPLTFNLDISTDCSSSDVLGYLHLYRTDR